MALLFFSDYILTPSTPKSHSVLMTLGLSASAALLEMAQGAAVIAVAVLLSGESLPTGVLSPGIVTGVNARSQRRLAGLYNKLFLFNS